MTPAPLTPAPLTPEDRPCATLARAASGGRGDGGAPRASPVPARPESGSLIRSSSVMAIGTLVSRGTGFLRTVMLVYALGETAHGVGNPYNNANTLPNVVYDLMLGGILTSVVVPLLVSAAKRNSRPRRGLRPSGCSPWPPWPCSR